MPEASEGGSVKVTLAKHGGWLAPLRLPPRLVDSDALAATAADELSRLIAAAKAVAGVPADRSGRAPQAMKYTITIDDGGELTMLRQSDTNLTPAFAALVAWLEQHSSTK